MTPVHAADGVVISHPHGNANVREAALALVEGGRLRQFWTGVAWNPDSRLAGLVPVRFRRQLERRAVAAELRPFLRLHPWREASRLAALRLGFAAASTGRTLSPNACHEDLDRRVAREIDRDRGATIAAVYAYDHAALESFRAAARHDVRRIYDLPIGYWRALAQTLAAEALAWPEWSALRPPVDFGSAEFKRKDAEIAAAEHVVVPSRFVAATLEAAFDRLAPLSVVPFGAPVAGAPRAARPEGDRLRLLYVGALDLRKGVQYLGAAWPALRECAELTVVGRAPAPCAALDRALVGARRIDTLPHREVLALMRESDVFVFPTLFEGMALVVLEAMSQGCAVVTTRSSGAADLVRDGHDGVLVMERSVDALVDAIRTLHADRALLRRIGAAAQTSRAGSWGVYRAGIRAVVDGVVGDAR
jgi:glycosyltransferase involved in cell wall biosynthesis